MKNARTIDPWISQYLIPIALIPASFSIFDPQDEQLPKPRIGEYKFRPVLCQGRLCRWIRLLASLQEEVQWGGEEGVAPDEVSYEREERRRRVDRRQEETRRGRVR